MKSIKVFIFFITLFIVFSCSKDTTTPNKGTEENITRDYRDCEINIAQLSEEDQLKQVIAEFVNEALKHDAFKSYLLNHLHIADRDADDIQNPEFLIAEHLSDNVDIGGSAKFGVDPGSISTLDDLFTNWISINNPDQLELFQNLCSQYSDFVLQFPWWSIDIIADQGGLDYTSIGSIGAIEPIECDGVHIRSFFQGDQEVIINVKHPLKKYIPIYVKTSELHIKIESSAQETINEMAENIKIYYEDCTFSDSELLSFVKTIDCSELKYADYSKMATFFKKNCSGVRNHETDCCDGEDNDGDGLIDCDDVEDCPCDVEICNDGCDNDNDGHIDEDCQCEGPYQRDCVPEDNVCVGLKFGEAEWLNICQLKEEGHIKVQLDLDAVTICDQSQGSVCTEDELTDIVIGGVPSIFFEIQKIHPNHDYYVPLSTLYENNILWMDESGTNYWKVFPLYVSFRKSYLEDKFNQWIPADIGSKISITAFELDNQSVTTSDSYTKTITTRHSFNSGATIGLSQLISTNFSYTFDNSKVSSATSVTNINYQKDVFINNYTIHYWDKDEVFPDPTGVVGNTWYGQIPGNSGTGLDGLYLEFRIHD